MSVAPSSNPWPANPFVLPGMEQSPNHPLNHWLEPGHRPYWVDLAQARAALTAFEQTIGKPGVLLSRGLFVVVSGEDGSGKTSLIYRCVARLEEMAATLKLNLQIADLTQVIPWGPDPTDRTTGEPAVTERAWLVFENLCEEIEHRIGLSHDVSTLFRSATTPQIAYRMLSRFLTAQKDARDGDNVVVVLLPATRAFPTELVRYAAAVYPRIIFFAETSLARSQWENELLRAAPSALSLRLDNLETEDYVAFAKNRMERHDKYGGSPGIPGIPDTTMRELAGERGRRPMTISELQAALYLTFEDHLSGAGRITEVTVNAIGRSFLRHVELPAAGA